MLNFIWTFLNNLIKYPVKTNKEQYVIITSNLTVVSFYISDIVWIFIKILLQVWEREKKATQPNEISAKLNID